jgi:aryl-alcohol dehydrogenase-like predicted oxidoreductase
MNDIGTSTQNMNGPPHSGLVLGTAQLGMEYGIANRTGRPDLEKASEIVQEAWSGGIRQFDTAQAYGESEGVLGRVLRRLGYGGEAKVISKLDPNLDHLDPSALSASLNASLDRLGAPRLFGLFLHREDLLTLWNKGLGDILAGFRMAGKVRHIGISVYSPESASAALKTEGMDLVQVPANILDQRFHKAGVLKQAHERRKTLYIRSVFLQGLILAEAGDLPVCMGFAKPLVKEIEVLARRMGVPKDEMALGYIKQRMQGSRVIFGAESPRQVRRNILLWKNIPDRDFVGPIEKQFHDVQENILRPDLWPA